MTVLRRKATCRSRAGAVGHHDHFQPAPGWRPSTSQPDATLVTAGAPAASVAPAYDRHAELRTPELADLREASRTDGRDISRAESAIGAEAAIEAG
jgi:hypothetical protein